MNERGHLLILFTLAAVLVGLQPVFAAQKGRVTNSEAVVFKDADFDSEILTSLKEGEVYDISSGQKGAFYKIRVKSGIVGWISDADIRPTNGLSIPANSSTPKNDLEQEAAKKNNSSKAPTLKPNSKKKQAQVKTKKNTPKSKPIQTNRYRGLDISQINFTEDVIGKLRSSTMSFLGFRMSGPGTLLEGESNIDAQVLVSFSAPSHYETATGLGATGFILLADFLFITDFPQTRDVMAYVGFGPMFRFSKINAELKDDPTPGKNKNYPMADAAIGGVLGAGAAVAVGKNFSVRLDARYYWETQKYTGLGIAIQQEF